MSEELKQIILRACRKEPLFFGEILTKVRKRQLKVSNASVMQSLSELAVRGRIQTIRDHRLRVQYKTVT